MSPHSISVPARRRRVAAPRLGPCESARLVTRLRAPSLVLAALFVVFACAPAAFAGRTFAVRPSPPWVKEVAPGADEGMSDADKGGSLFLLDDHQTRVAGARTERFYRHVKKILSAAGLEESAEFALPFEPSYQELLIHHIRIVRGGRVIDALDPREIKVIQQEDELNQRLYNGQLSAVVFLKDVRVGDLIDYAYSVNGDNPVMGGRFADDIRLADSEAIQKLHCRLLWPAGRALSLRNQNTELQPRTTGASEGFTEYVWERERVAALEYEDSTPPWFSPMPHVQLSEFEDWGEVVRWALPLYEVKSLSPELRRKIEEWRTESDDPGRRLLAALRFVQDEVRYLGIELGQYSHRPSQPSLVFARRFGDCKDKSLLLSTALNALGIESRLALVNTESRSALDTWQPSPYGFDHVIVRASLGGRTYWLDPTISQQRGSLDTYYPPDYARALVLIEGTELLEVIPPASPGEGAAAAAATTTVEEVYTLTSHASHATHEVTTTYRGPDADAMRYTLSQQSLNDLAKNFLNYYAERDPSVTADGPPRVSDDAETNTVVVRERYTVPDFWRDGKRELWADRVYAELSKPGVAQRAAPLAVPFPRHVRQTIEVRLPESFNIPAESFTIANEALSLAYSFARRGNTVRLEFTLRSLADHVPAGRVTKHLEDLGRMQRAAGFELTRDTTASGIGMMGPATNPAYFLFGAMALLTVPCAILFAVIVWALERRRRKGRVEEWREPEAQPQARGSEPSSAVRVRSEEDLLGHVRDWRSSCGRAFFEGAGDDLPHERLSYDDESLVLVRLRCEACGDVRESYFVGPQATGAANVPVTS